MRAIETGLLSVENLKGHETSVHAAGGTFRREHEDAAYEAPAAEANSVAAGLLITNYLAVPWRSQRSAEPQAATVEGRQEEGAVADRAHTIA